jgi:hypothetical protein
MEHITETKRWKYWEDKMAEKQYKEMYPVFTHVTPKDRKITLIVALKGKDRKYWSKVKSKNLGGILKKLDK